MPAADDEITILKMMATARWSYIERYYGARVEMTPYIIERLMMMSSAARRSYEIDHKTRAQLRQRAPR